MAPDQPQQTPPTADTSMASADLSRVQFPEFAELRKKIAELEQLAAAHSDPTRYSRELLEVKTNAKNYLGALGVNKETPVALLSKTRTEWGEIEDAIWARRGIGVSVYAADPADKNVYALYDSGSKIVCVENQQQLDKVIDLITNPHKIVGTDDRAELTTTLNIEKIICLEKVKVCPQHEHLIVQAEDILTGKAPLPNGGVMKPVEPASRDDIASIIYTSGTTGAPKGVVATHGEHLANIRQTIECDDLFSQIKSILHVLPEQAHAFGRRMRHITTLAGIEAKYLRVAEKQTSELTLNARKFMTQDIKEANASVIPAVPKMLERFKEGILAKLSKPARPGRFARFVNGVYSRCKEAEAAEKSPGFMDRCYRFMLDARPLKIGEKNIAKQSRPSFTNRMAKFAIGVYTRCFEAEESGNKPSFGDRMKRVLIEAWPLRIGPKVKDTIKSQLTGPDFKCFISGGAALPRHIAVFFGALDMPIFDGYGSTETNVPIALNTPNNHRLGSVGRVIAKDIEIKLSDEGELLVRSKNLAHQYYGRPGATKKTWDAEGWYHTRDNVKIDKDGYIYMQGRVDDVLKTTTGEFIQANPIEDKIKSSKYLRDAVLIGHGRSCVTSLVVLNEDTVRAWSKEQGLTLRNPMREDPAVQKMISEEVKKLANNSERRYEWVRGVGIIPEPTVGNGMTASYKLQRDALARIHVAMLDKMYGEIESERKEKGPMKS